MGIKEKIKKQNMTDLASYRTWLRTHPKLAYLFVELTDKCNLNCLHCGSSCEQTNNQFIETSLLLRTLVTVSEDFDPFTIMICFTGGEPLLHPDFIQIVRETVRLGFCWGITTNGMLVDEEKALEMKRCGLKSITISLDGLEEMHDWLRNKKGSFQRTIEAIEQMNRVDIPVQVTTVVHKRNFHELEKLYQFLCSQNISSWRIINIEPIGKARQNKNILLSRSEFLRMLDFIKEKRYSNTVPMDVHFGCSHYLSYEYEHEVRDNYFLCGAGIYVASILCNGDIFSCLDIERRPEWIQGNIKKDRFSKIWNTKFERFRTDRTCLSDGCTKCKERFFCGADSLHTWDFDANEPLFCILKENDDEDEKEFQSRR